ncbi:MAG: erythromycin esterase family protein [Niabella sp.]|nr:erythromycin esterase family protein [Niabella sp.]
MKIGIEIVIFIFLLIADTSFAQGFPRIGPLSLDSNSIWVENTFGAHIPENIQLIGLGEVSHGGFEPMAFKAKMVQFLVEKKGYRKILFEISNLTCAQINNILVNSAINNLNVVDSILELSEMPVYPVSRSQTMLNLFRWLKKYNLSHPKNIVTIAGIDFPNNANEFYNYFMYNYLVPIDNVHAQKLIAKWEINASDSLQTEDMFLWFIANKQKLSVALTKKEFSLLSLNIENELNNCRYRSLFFKNNLAASIFRDSVMAVNVKYLAGNDKAIVWAHNAHIYKGEPFMGMYLTKWYQSKYYVILTDYSMEANVYVRNIEKASSGPDYLYLKKLSPENSTTSFQLLHNFGVSKGVFFQNYLNSKNLSDRIDAISTPGIQSVIGSTKAFDALVIFDQIKPDLKHVNSMQEGK